MALELAIYDVSSFVHSAMNTQSLGKRRKNGMFVGGLYKVMNKLTSQIQQGMDIILAFDSRSFRKDIMPEYKAGRKSVPVVYAQLDFLYKNLYEMGLPVYRIDGLEADDIIYNAVEDNRDKYRYIKIYSTDYDLVHNVDDTRTVEFISITGTTNNVYYDTFGYAMPNYKGLLFNTLTAYKALVGDASDNIGSFKSENGIYGKKFYELYKVFLNKTNLLSYKATTNKQVFLSFLKAFKHFTDRDRAELAKRADVFYPKRQEINWSYINKKTCDLVSLIEFLALIGDVDSLKNLRVDRPINAIPVPREKIDDMYKLSNSLVTGEYQADRGMRIEDYLDSGSSNDISTFKVMKGF